MTLIEGIAQDINTLIVKRLIEYDTYTLGDIVIALVLQHAFTTKDTIDYLIEDLEKERNLLK